LVQNAFYGIRPVVTGLIAAAAVAIAQTSIFTGALTPQLFIGIFARPLQYIDVKSLIIFVGSLASLIWWKKLHPILLLAIAGLVGAIIF
jgi:chromate transporter